jgi:hypothetical protein
MIIHFLGLQLKLLHNAYYISPIFHTNSTLISHIIKAAKAVPHCFAMTNTIWQNQVPVIFLMTVTYEYLRQGRSKSNQTAHSRHGRSRSRRNRVIHSTCQCARKYYSSAGVQTYRRLTGILSPRSDIGTNPWYYVGLIDMLGSTERDSSQIQKFCKGYVSHIRRFLQ